MKTAIIILLGFSLITFELSAQELNWRELTPESGFPSMNVGNVLHDSRGFLWFGTSEGIIRYDGAQYKTWYPDRNDSSKLLQAFPHYTFEDSRGRIWISAGTGFFSKKTVQVYDPRQDQFTFIDASPVNHYFDYHQMQAENYFVEDEEGNIWIKCFVDGLYKVTETDEGTFEVNHYRHEKSNPYHDSADSINVLYQDKDNRLWVGTKKGLYHFDKENERFVQYTQANIDDDDEVTGMVSDSKGRTWVNFGRQGLCMMDLENDTIISQWRRASQAYRIYDRRYLMIDKFDNIWMLNQGVASAGNARLSSYNIHTGERSHYLEIDPDKPETLEYGDLLPFIDPQGKFWVSSRRDLYHYNYQSKTIKNFSRLDHLIEEDRFLMNCFVDKGENVWLFVDQKGILHYNSSNQKFTTISPQSVSGALEDEDGNIWASGYEGLFRYKLSPDFNIERAQHIIESDLCYEPMLDSEGHVWVSCQENTFSPLVLYKVDRQTGGKVAYSYDPGDSTSISSTANAFIRLNNGKFLVETWSQGLDYFDPNTGKARHLRHNPDDSTSISSDIWAKVMVDDEDNVWVFSQTGLDLFEPETGLFTRIDTNSSNRFGIIHDLIRDAEDNFWIAGGYGLFQYDPQKNEIINHYSASNGLPNNELRKILEDNSGHLWVGSQNGLVRFDKKTKKFWTYTTSDGLPTSNISPLNSYNGSPKGSKCADGSLIFGTRKGSFIFHPDSLPVNTNLPETTITDLQLFNEEVEVDGKILKQDLPFTDALQLRHDQNVVTFSYAALSFANPDKNQYAYIMEGVDRDWNYVGNQTFANYANLSPGEYTFRVKAANNDGLWNETPASLAITVLPPWWQTNWAYLLYALLFFSGIYAIYHYQLRRKLQMAETRRLQELDLFKSRFYTNITHEFRTPLTVILGMTEEVKGGGGKVKSVIRKNAHQLLQLVNQLLDLSRLESGKLKVQYQQGDIVNFIKYLLNSFQSMATHKHISLALKSDLAELYMDYDADKIQAIVTNLLSNAIKFSPKGGLVTLDLRQEKRKHQNYLLLRVSDRGIGIPEDKLPYIFDRFYQVDGSSTRQGEGTGIGLSLSRELTHLMSGEIQVSSTPGEGTVFTVFLPIHQDAPINEPDQTQALPDLSQDLFEQSNYTHLPEATDQLPVALLVEDNADVVDYLTQCLEGRYAVRVAYDGEQGIQMALSQLPDIIISDVMMPKVNGYQLCETLKSNIKTSHIPIMMLTAKAAEEDMLEGLRVGVDAYLSKPFNRKELMLRIENLITQRGKLQNHYQASLPYHPGKVDISTPDQQFMDKALSILDQHKSDPEFSSQALQQALGMSRTLLHTKLKSLTGMSATNFIRTYRLKYAARLIEQNYGNYAQIAYESGFRDQSYFTKSFKKEFGVAPSEYGNTEV